MAIQLQPKINLSLEPLKLNFSSQALPKTPNLCFKPKPSYLSMLKFSQRLKLSATAADPILSQEEIPPPKEKLGVVVKPMEKPRIVLKLIWMQKSIGVALDQVIPGFGTIPLSSYYFWPKEDAWEQLKVLLENKPWISKRQMYILLNQATDLINLWQESGGNLK